ncbi:hypothetical protein [Nostoc commune]|uniref:hypothetical protein n=1 Tax=Nostoc commune TaxID=1178 RepID=UPI002072B12A|nr:hypothetical protein [Nostoc commune]
MRLQFDNKINLFPATSRLTLTGDASCVATAKKSPVVSCREIMDGVSFWGANAFVTGVLSVEEVAWQPRLKGAASPPHWLTAPENLRVNVCFYC